MKPIVKALIFDSEKNLLILYRSPTHPYWPHGIDFPGGDVEEGEPTTQALAREILEETGLELSESQLVLATKRLSKGRDQIVFRAQIDELKPAIELSWEHEDYSWVSPVNLPSFQDTVDDPFYKTALLTIKYQSTYIHKHPN